MKLLVGYSLILKTDTFFFFFSTLEQIVRIVVQLWTSTEQWGLLKLHQTGEGFCKAPGSNLCYHEPTTLRAGGYIHSDWNYTLALLQHATFSF